MSSTFGSQTSSNRNLFDWRITNMTECHKNARQNAIRNVMTATGERSSHNDHTPGPWYCPGINSKYGVSDWKQANITTGSEYSPIIATVYTEEPTYLGEIDHDTMLANAALIASAPDLLAALESLVEMDDDPIRYMACRSYRIDAARAAIEKAKGS